MKKCLFYLLVVLCALSFFSCGDDKKEPKPEEDWKQIAGDYSAGNLELMLNNVKITRNKVKVEAVSEEKITISLPNLLPGVNELKVDATLKKASSTTAEDGTLFYLEGETKLTNDSREVVVLGNFRSDTLILAVNVIVDSPVIGNWRLAPVYQGIEINGDGYDVMNGCFFLSLTNPDHQISFMGKTMTDKEFCSVVDQQAEMFLTATLKEIVFQPHGGVTLIYSKDGKDVVLSDLAGFYEKDKMIYLTLDIGRLMNLLRETKAELIPDGIEELAVLAHNGIPFIYEDGGNFCTLEINKEMAEKMLPVLPALGILQGLMAGNPEAAALLGEIGKLATDIPSYNKFQVGFNLMKIQ